MRNHFFLHIGTHAAATGGPKLYTSAFTILSLPPFSVSLPSRCPYFPHLPDAPFGAASRVIRNNRESTVAFRLIGMYYPKLLPRLYLDITSISRILLLVVLPQLFLFFHEDNFCHFYSLYLKPRSFPPRVSNYRHSLATLLSPEHRSHEHSSFLLFVRSRAVSGGDNRETTVFKSSDVDT